MNRRVEDKVMVQLKGQIVGPWPVSRLTELKGFTPQTYICHPGTDNWAPAFRIIKLARNDVPLAISSGAAPIAPWFLPGIGFTHSPTPSHERYIRVMDFTAPRLEGWVDRWFRRLAVLNTLLALSFVMVWHHPPARKQLKHEWKVSLRLVRQNFSLK